VSSLLFIISGRIQLAFLVFINQLLQFVTEYSAVIAAHLGAAHKAGFVTLDTDHPSFLLRLFNGNYKTKNVVITRVNSRLPNTTIHGKKQRFYRSKP